MYYKKTFIPIGPLNEKKTAEFIKEYELNERHNEEAIETAKRSYKKLQDIHNK